MDLLELFFKSNPNFISKHHLDSYNEFTEKTVQKVIESMNPFPIIKEKVSVYVYVYDVHFTKPKSLPNYCRMNNDTYMSQLMGTIKVVHNNKEQIYPDTFLCNVPVMVHSNLCLLKDLDDKQLTSIGECPYDHGGYFIINGKEKVIVSQEHLVANKLFIADPVDPDHHKFQAFIKCTSDSDSVFPKTLWLYDNIKKGITVKVTHIETEIPLFVLFRALGVESDLSILKLLKWTDMKDDFLRPTIVTASGIAYTQMDALNWLKKYTNYNTIDNVRYILLEDFLPNVPYGSFEKAEYLAMLVGELLEVARGVKEITNRDNYINKRVGISGFLLGDIFKDFYNNFRVKTRSKIDNILEFGKFETLSNPGILFQQSEAFREGLIKSLKGNWGMMNDPKMQGIVQDLSRISHMACVSHLRRVNTPIDSTIKVRKPHQLDGSQWGVMCPCESPDGGSIGLLKNMALMCFITSSYSSKHIYDALNSHSHFKFRRLNNLSGYIDTTRLCINNNWVGEVQNPKDVVMYLKLLKRNGFINQTTSITWNVFKHTINILTESGRCCRPLLCVDNGIVVINTKRFNGEYTWNDLVGGALNKDTFINPFEKFSTNSLEKVFEKLSETVGAIEWIDIEEMNLSNISTDPKHVTKYTTHCEIHPSSILSAYTSTIPFLNHNPSPRNVFSGAQGKQAIGVYSTNFNQRIDTLGYILHHPQKPIVHNKMSEILHANKLPNGENLIVAIATYTGYNQEDSIIINKASIERGMFNITSYKAIVAEEESKSANGTIAEKFFANPIDWNIPNQKYANYATIDKETGLPKINSWIEENDCVFGMVAKETNMSTKDSQLDGKAVLFEESVKTISYRNVSKVADKTVSGYIDKVYVGNKKAKVRMRKVKVPEFGDKMASRHGQKGVVGLILSPEDMPFTKEGLVPDIIINPHAFPSRMTIGHLMESLIAKYFVISGRERSFTPFDDFDMSQITKGLAERGYASQGDEVMYNGYTGAQMSCEIFIGPTYYYRLKHMVSDKINYRTSDGKVMGLTKQPPKGRSNGGGLRIGEMETNVLISYGFGSFIKESMMERSDKTKLHVNDRGIITPYNKKNRIEFENIKTVELPYAFKLLVQELGAASINVAIHSKEFTSDEEEDCCDDTFDDDV
jgi:DNA-directed RNA polymerase II subunit RPB2